MRFLNLGFLLFVVFCQIGCGGPEPESKNNEAPADTKTKQKPSVVEDSQAEKHIYFGSSVYCVSKITLEGSAESYTPNMKYLSISNWGSGSVWFSFYPKDSKIYVVDIGGKNKLHMTISRTTDEILFSVGDFGDNSLSEMLVPRFIELKEPLPLDTGETHPYKIMHKIVAPSKLEDLTNPTALSNWNVLKDMTSDTLITSCEVTYMKWHGEDHYYPFRDWSLRHRMPQEFWPKK